MFRFSGADGLRSSDGATDAHVERLERLAADILALRDGRPPTSEALTGAPFLEGWIEAAALPGRPSDRASEARGRGSAHRDVGPLGGCEGARVDPHLVSVLPFGAPAGAYSRRFRVNHDATLPPARPRATRMEFTPPSRQASPPAAPERCRGVHRALRSAARLASSARPAP